MAFMMPVMKNEFDIYNGSRSRKVSECSNASGCRSRKISECRSECPSLSTSPGAEYIGSPGHRPSYNRTSSRPFSRNSSRTSQGSFVVSPTKGSQACSPPKPATTNGSQGSLNKFHTRLVDKLRRSLHNNVVDAAATATSSTPSLGSSTQNILNQNIVTSTRALKIDSADTLNLDDDDDDNDDLILATSSSPSSIIKRRTSAPISSCSRRRGSSLTTSTENAVGIASASTGDIHSSSDVDDDHQQILVKTKPPLPLQQLQQQNSSNRKRRSLFRRSRHGTCSAPR